MPVTIEALVILAGIAVAMLCWHLLPTALTQGDRLVLRKRLLHPPARPAGDPVPETDRLAAVSEFIQAGLPVSLRLQLEGRLVMAACFGKRALAVTVGIKVLLTVVGAAFG
ncbi:MAG: hypothetical protein H7338_20190, partial [Candidatus Sericytochromatia bacterium]|nr:hypothetical protein [Candidatus Sericytochromatia bacterium]